MTRIRDRIRELRRVPASSLIPDERNYRMHPPEQRSALQTVLEEVGIADALLVREDADGQLRIIDGHLRSDMLDQDVPVLVLDVDENEAGVILGTLDPLAAMATRDDVKLRELIESLSTGDDVTKLLAQLEGPRPKELLGDPDGIPEDVEPRTEPGDLWLLGEHRVLCGDATKRADYTGLLGGVAPDLLITDPPYGVTHGSGVTEANAIRGDLGQAVIPLSFACAVEVLAKDARLYIFGGSNQFSMYLGLWDHHLHALPRIIVWVKESFVMRQVGYHSQFELLYWGWKGKGGGPTMWFGDRTESDVWHLTRDRDLAHPTQKPVEAFQRAIRNSAPPDGVVLDPFLGSGTAVVAAEVEGRICYGMEVDPRHVDTTTARWEALTGRIAEKAT